MDEHGTCLSLAGAHDIEISIAVQIDEERIFGIAYIANGYRRPVVFYAALAGVDIDTYDTALFPGGSDVEPSILDVPATSRFSW